MINKKITRKKCAMCGSDGECTALLKGRARCYDCNFYISKLDYLKRNGRTYTEVVSALRA